MDDSTRKVSEIAEKIRLITDDIDKIYTHADQCLSTVKYLGHVLSLVRQEESVNPGFIGSNRDVMLRLSQARNSIDAYLQKNRSSFLRSLGESVSSLALVRSTVIEAREVLESDFSSSPDVYVFDVELERIEQACSLLSLSTSKYMEFLFFLKSELSDTDFVNV